MEISTGLSDYERVRLENIKRNQLMMNSLGLDERAKLKPRLPIQKQNTKIAQKKQRGSPVQFRKSSRIAGIKAPDYTGSKALPLIERNLDDRKPRASLRRIKSKPIPEVSAEELEERGEWDPNYRAPIPLRNEDGTLKFEKEYSHFQPNLTPQEMIRLGSFGGTFFRPIYSRIAKKEFENDYLEFPSEWWEGLDPEVYLTADEYDPNINHFKIKAGQGLEEWENAGWIRAQDPRGWFQWYSRFYLGRRTPDDDRQIRRWIGVCGSNGRFKRSLANKIAQKGGKNAWDDPKISPQVRQTLQHWGYKLTKEDYEAFL